MKLSILIPVYNEEKTIITILNRIKKVNLDSIQKEIIVINDGSFDQTDNKIKTYIQKNENKITYISFNKNHGKGFAIREGLKKTTGDIILIQDADLEYNPEEYSSLLFPILNNKADVVYGSRFSISKPHRVLYYWHYLANKLLTFFSNILTQLNLSDMECGYKVFKREVITSLSLKENRFGFEPEVTAKISKIKNIKIYEVGISYSGRTYEEGKKIGLKDAIAAFYFIIRYKFFK